MNIAANHLTYHGYITPGIWLLVYGKTNGLAQRISDLRARRWKIDTVREKDDTGKNMVKYILCKEGN